MVSFDAMDQLPKGVTLFEEEPVSLRARKLADTGNLSSRLELNIGARVMLINNIEISDRLINGQIGAVKYIKSTAEKITKTNVFFDDNQAGLREISHDDLSRRHQWVPIERTEASFSIRKKSFTIKRTVSINIVICMRNLQGSRFKLLYILIYIGRSHSYQVTCVWLRVEL